MDSTDAATSNGSENQRYTLLRHPSGSPASWPATAALPPTLHRRCRRRLPPLLPSMPSGICCLQAHGAACSTLAALSPTACFAGVCGRHGARQPKGERRTVGAAPAPLLAAACSATSTFQHCCHAVRAVQAVQDVVSLIQRVAPAVVVLELDPQREHKLLEQVSGWACVSTIRLASPSGWLACPEWRGVKHTLSSAGGGEACWDRISAECFRGNPAGQLPAVVHCRGCVEAAHAPSLPPASLCPLSGGGGGHLWREEVSGQVQLAGGCRHRCWRQSVSFCVLARGCDDARCSCLLLWHLYMAAHLILDESIHSSCLAIFPKADCEDELHGRGAVLLHELHLHHHGELTAFSVVRVAARSAS